MLEYSVDLGKLIVGNVLLKEVKYSRRHAYIVKSVSYCNVKISVS